MYVRLIQAYDAVESEERRRQMSAAASRLRLCVSGSAAMPVPVAKRWSEIANGKELLERYGATEIGMALSQPLAGRRVPGRVGHPLPGVQVKLVDGELRVKGPGVFGGYVGRPEATAACFDETGSSSPETLTEYDENLGYGIMGRTSVDIIKHGGYKLSALEIESAVLEHPGVGECAVCGVPDDVYGEIVGCVLAPGPGGSDGARFLRRRPRGGAARVPERQVGELQGPRRGRGRGRRAAQRDGEGEQAVAGRAFRREIDYFVSTRKVQITGKGYLLTLSRRGAR